MNVIWFKPLSDCPISIEEFSFSYSQQHQSNRNYLYAVYYPFDLTFFLRWPRRDVIVRYHVWQFQCCGIDSYEDFSEAKDWKTDYTVTRHGFIKNIKLKTPVVCCKSKSTSTGGGGSPNNSTVVQSNCAEAPTDANSNWKTVIHLFRVFFYFNVFSYFYIVSQLTVKPVQ